MSLNDAYEITYKFYLDDTEITDTTGISPVEGILTSLFSKKTSTFTLPEMSKEGCTFIGWHNEYPFTDDNLITEITQGTTGPITLYALFEEQSSGGGNNGGNSTPNLDDFILVSGAIIKSDLSNSAFSSCATNPITIRDLYVCTHEVTQAEYEQYCIYGDTAPDTPSNADQKSNYPVYNVSWYDAIVYCNLRSLDETLIPVYSIGNSTNPDEWEGIVRGSGSDVGKYCAPSDQTSAWEWNSGYPGYDSIVVNKDADGYRLPTELEWEYFARGGNGLTGDEAALENSGCTDANLKNYAHVASWDETRLNTDSVFPIKEKLPNGLGLYDLCGNVYEMCFDVQADGDYRSAFDGYYIQNGLKSVTSNNRNTGSFYGFRVVRNIQNYVDMGTGTLWATSNIGAETITDYGDYFAWGETDTRYNEVYRSNKKISWKSAYDEKGYSWTGYFDGANGTNFTYYKDEAGNNVLSSTHDAATQKRGDKWRIPTPEEWQALLNNCCIVSTDDYNGSKIPGVILYKAKDDSDKGKNTIKDSGETLTGTYSVTDTHLFFPAAGYFSEATASDCGLNSFNEDVLLWGNSIMEDYRDGEAARMVPLKSNSGYSDPIEDEYRYYGLSIRPVYVE